MSRSFGETSFTTRPPIERVPSEMSSRPATMRSAVVLPQPDGPTSTRNSPSWMSSVRSKMAWTPLSYTLSTSLNATSAMVTSFQRILRRIGRADRLRDKDAGSVRMGHTDATEDAGSRPSCAVDRLKVSSGRESHNPPYVERRAVRRENAPRGVVAVERLERRERGGDRIVRGARGEHEQALVLRLAQECDRVGRHVHEAQAAARERGTRPAELRQ